MNMASYFGEVLETSSRAYDGECEDVTSVNGVNSCKYELSWISGDSPEETDLFFIVDGKCCLGFSALLAAKAEAIAKILPFHTRDNEADLSQLKRKESPSYIYKLKSGVLVCEVSADVKVIHANYFTAKLHEFLTASKEVIVLTSRGSISWKSHISPFLKGLANNSYITRRKELLAATLETPNLVTGVSASVLIFCEVKKIPASLYVCYSPKEEIDSHAFSVLHKFFSQIPEVELILNDISYESKETESFTRTGNLYL